VTRLLAVVGPTASGKSAVALALAEHLGAEILSVDSMQVYRGMDIGTAKPTPHERSRVRHHMIDVVDASEEYTVAWFQQEARAIIENSTVETLILVGGTGLHFRAVVDPMRFPGTDPDVRAAVEALDPTEARRRLLAIDPRAGEAVDLDNPRRVTRALEIYEVAGLTPTQRTAAPERRALEAYEPELPFVAIGLDPGDRLEPRVRGRLRSMIDAGLVEEVESLRGRMSRTASGAVGYRQLMGVVTGEKSLDEGLAAAEKATVGLARRQRTFFRRDPRIEWLEWRDDPTRRAVDAAARLLEQVR